MNKTIWYVTKYFSPKTANSPGGRGWFLVDEMQRAGYQVLVISSDSNNLVDLPVLQARVTQQEAGGVKIVWLKTMKYSVAKSLRRILSWFHFEWNLFWLDKSQLPRPDVVIISSLSLLTIIMGHVLICTPFAVAILSSAFQSLDQSLEEAAYDLGESPLSTFWLIILPLVMPGIISSLLICFTISLDEFIIAYFLGGNETVLSVYIYGQFRFPAKVPAIMALGTILVLLSITLLAIAEYFRRRGIAKAGGKDSGGFL